MDKIILKDGTIIEIEESSNSDSFRKQFSDPQEYLTALAQLTQDNLSAYKVLNSAGFVCANLEKKECLKQTITVIWDNGGALAGLDVTFNITDVNLVAKDIKDLQEVQGGAIADLVTIAGGAE
ncbi:MAG: hypothetical protein QM683_05990 [Lacrimispora sp.]